MNQSTEPIRKSPSVEAIRGVLLRGLALAWGVAIVVGAGGVMLGFDAAGLLYLAMPPVTLAVVWIWRRLGVARQHAPATF